MTERKITLKLTEQEVSALHALIGSEFSERVPQPDAGMWKVLDRFYSDTLHPEYMEIHGP